MRRKNYTNTKEVKVYISFGTATIFPRQRLGKKEEPITLSVVRCFNEEENIDWILYSTIPISSFEEAVEKTNWYATRWTIEIFIEDWSCYNGFCSLAKQCGVEGSERPLIMSLLFDHCFFFHQHQQISIENKLPLGSFGSLLEKTRFEALCHFINTIIDSQSPKEKLRSLIEEADHVFEFRNSTKHLSGVIMDIKQLHTAA